MTSPWQEYKKKLGETRPWDLVNPKTEWASEELATQRFDICKQCPQLIKGINQCKECGCFMAAKTRLSRAECPLHKW